MPETGWDMHEISKAPFNHEKSRLTVSRADIRALTEFERRAKVAFAQEIVARAYQISVAEIKAPTRRTAPVALARQIAMYLMHVVFGMSLSAVGRHFGRDRTTVSHACRQIEDRRDDATFDLLVDRLEFAVWSTNTHKLEFASTITRGTHANNADGGLIIGLNQ